MAVVASLFGNVATPLHPEAIGTAFSAEYEITFSGATDYVTNGVVINTPSLFGLNVVDQVVPYAIGPSLAAGIFAWSYDKTNGKVKFYTSGAAEVANAANISSIKLYARVRGH